MKYLFNGIVITVALLSATGIAANPPDFDIDKSCKQHAISVVKALKQQVATDMDTDDIKAALAIANQSCHKYFGTPVAAKQVQENRAVARTESNTPEQTTGDDWFSKYVFEGNPHEKAGVQRLKNRKR